MPKIIPALLVLSLAVACSDGVLPDERSGTDETTPQSISNGTRDTGHPAVVYLRGHVSGGSSWGCTGTLIYPETILTAAHCIASIPTDGSSSANRVDVFINDDFAAGRSRSAFSTNFVWDTGYDPAVGVSQHDIGIILLSNPLPGITPIPLYTGSELGIGSIALIVGYGSTSDPPNNNRSKYMGLTTISTYQDGTYLSDPNNASGACRGDSGGPLLAWFGIPLAVAGVTSGGNFSSSENCSVDESTFVDVLPHANWINLASYAWARQH
jgi:secreted trypsin-like serine protease